MSQTENTPLEHLRKSYGVDVAGYIRAADLLNGLSKALAKQLALDLTRLAQAGNVDPEGSQVRSTEHTEHHLFDFLLVQFAGDIVDRRDKDVFSACLDGIHWHCYGQSAQEAISSLLAYWATNQHCFMITFIEEFDLFRSASLLGYTMDPPQEGAIEASYLSELLVSMLEHFRQSLPAQLRACQKS